VKEELHKRGIKRKVNVSLKEMEEMAKKAVKFAMILSYG